MKRVNNFIGYTPEVSGEYVNYKNKTIQIAPSYNNLLSKVLEEAYILSARDIVSKDKKLTTLTKGEIYENVEPYLRLYPEIIEGNEQKLLDEMKTNIKNAMKRNSDELDINFKQEENEKNVRDNK